MKTRQTIRWGIVGCGDVCEVKSGPGFQKATGSELVAVMRRDAAKARDFAVRHDVPKWHRDAMDLIHDLEVDAIYVATPPGSHRDISLEVAKAGKPCYVEKPMARTHAECQEMVHAFEAAGVPLFVAYYRRCLPRFVALKKLLEQNHLGRIESIRYELANGSYLQAEPDRLPWRLQPELSGGGLLLDLGSHLIDLLDHLFGPLQDIRGRSQNISRKLALADRTELSFITLEGVTGVGCWNFASEINCDRLEVTGELGSVELSCFGNEPLKWVSREGITFLDNPNPVHVHQPLIQTIVDELLGKGGSCPSTGVSASRASRIMELVG